MSAKKWLLKLYNYINIKIKKIEIGNGWKINGILKVYGTCNVKIGDNVIINSSPLSNPVAGGYRTNFYTGVDGKIQIGNNVGISHTSITSFSKILIEDNVLIGSNCMIIDTDFHSLNVYERIQDSAGKCAPKAPVHIGRGAFIGAKCIILKGVNIGENSVVGAGSVVTRCIPENELWAGNPAAFIRKLTENSQESE